MSSQTTMKINVSESNGHPTRKFRNIRFTNIPLAVGDDDCEVYNCDGLSIKMPKVMNCFNNLYPEVVKAVAEHRANGISEKDLCDNNISKLSLQKVKVQMLRLANGNWTDPKNRRILMEEYIDLAHGIITCAYLGAIQWGERFGIMLCDGTMPLVPEDEIGTVCRQIAEIARADMEKSEAEKKTTPKKFTYHFTPASIDAGVSWFKIWIADGEGSSYHTLERYNEIFQDCKKWATGENGTDRNINFTWDATNITQKEVGERLDEYYMKSKIFLFMLSIYNKGHSCKSVEGHRDFKIFNAEVEKSGFEILQQQTVGKVELVGFIGIYTKEEWDALQKRLPTAKYMRRDETQKKGAKLCCCGCGTFQKKLLKATCCGARYVDAEHQKKDWAEHKKVCEDYKKKKTEQKRADEKKIEDMIEEGYKSILEEIKEKPLLEQQEILDIMSGKMSKMPTNREEELAMFVCPMSCDGCDYCEYVPKFALKE